LIANNIVIVKPLLPTINFEMSEKLNESLNELRIASESTDIPIVLVDSRDTLTTAAHALSTHDRIAFDTEGVNLSRTGDLTIATMQGLGGVVQKESPIYIIDVLVLTSEKVFSKESPSIRSILEDSSVTKVTFDCRSDSDALYHQHGVSLVGAFDLQIFDQAVRIHKGELPPKRNEFICKGGIPFLPSMEKVVQRYSIETSVQKSRAPHLANMNVWKQRPLTTESIEYAANDVHIIKRLLQEMTKSEVSDILMQRTVEHSKRYESMFRDRSEEVGSYYQDKDYIMEEHAIVTENELPAGHPRIVSDTPSYTMQKWNKAITALESKLPSAYNDVMFVLQHNDWYTDSGRQEMRRLAAAHPFTYKQRGKILNTPSLVRRDEDDYYNYDDDNDCDDDYYDD
jgi:hypothetical protein